MDKEKRVQKQQAQHDSIRIENALFIFSLRKFIQQ